MKRHRECITPLQLSTIIVSTIIGVSVLALPRFVVEAAGTGSPLAGLTGIATGFIGLLAIVFLGRRFPKTTIIGYNEIILGTWMGRTVSVLLILFFCILMGLETRQFAEIVLGALLPNTPISIPILLLLLLCATTGFQSVATFAYIHFFYMPLIIIPILVVIIPAFKDIEMYHLTPILGHEFSVTNFLSGGMVVVQAMLGFFVIAMIIPSMKDPMKCMPSSFLGYSVGSFFVLSIIVMTLAVFGEREIQQLYWPTLILGRMVHVPAELLARIDAVLIISWIYGVFTTKLSYYFIVVRGLGELFRFYNYRRLAFSALPFVFTIAMFSKNIYQMYDWILSVTCYGLVVTIIYPVVLSLVELVRKKGVETV